MAITSSECLKCAFGCLSLAVAVGGVTILGVGVTALVRDDWQLVRLLDAGLCPAVGVVLTVAGGVVMLLAMLATCGAVYEDRRLLGAFFWLALLLLVVMGIGIVVGFAMGGQRILEDVRGEMKDSIKKYFLDEDVHEAWNSMQENFQCCGVDDGTDWAPLLGFNHVPPSCCKDGDFGPSRCTATFNSYNVGCVKEMTQVVERYSAAIGGTTVTVAVLLLLTTVSSYALMKSSEGANRYMMLCQAGSI